MPPLPCSAVKDAGRAALNDIKARIGVLMHLPSANAVRRELRELQSGGWGCDTAEDDDPLQPAQARKRVTVDDLVLSPTVSHKPSRPPLMRARSTGGVGLGGHPSPSRHRLGHTSIDTLQYPSRQLEAAAALGGMTVVAAASGPAGAAGSAALLASLANDERVPHDMRGVLAVALAPDVDVHQMLHGLTEAREKARQWRAALVSARTLLETLRQPQAVQQLLWYLRPVLALGVEPPPPPPEVQARIAAAKAAKAEAKAKRKKGKKKGKKKKDKKKGGDDDEDVKKEVLLPHFLSDLRNGAPAVLVEQTRIAFHQLMEAVSMQIVRPAFGGPTPDPSEGDVAVRACLSCRARVECMGVGVHPCAVC